MSGAIYKAGDIILTGGDSVALVTGLDTVGDYMVMELLAGTLYRETNIYNETRSSHKYEYLCNIEDILRQIQKTRGG